MYAVDLSKQRIKKNLSLEMVVQNLIKFNKIKTQGSKKFSKQNYQKRPQATKQTIVLTEVNCVCQRIRIQLTAVKSGYDR